MTSSSSSSSESPWILVTGGCGYLGSHTLVLLLQAQYRVVVVDNLINSSVQSLDRVAQICQLSEEERKARLLFYEVDLCHRDALKQVFQNRSPDKFQACIHFAGLKAVGESTRIPLRYYQNNLDGTFHLLELMDEFDCHQLAFSSSATVYGAVDQMPLTEETPVGAGITNAYGRTKYMIEEVCKDFYNSKTLDTNSTTDWSIVVLRYFNPVGSHPSGLIGEDPNGIPNNLMPYVAQVAVGRRPHLTVFGNDYPTQDGTGVRDYVHVMDLAQGHIAAVDYINRDGGDGSGLYTFNLGTGIGYSVLDMVSAMSKACGREIKYEVGPRRPGDIAICYACPKKAKDEMKWEATRNLDEMCRDLWAWQLKNPNGYVDAK